MAAICPGLSLRQNSRDHWGWGQNSTSLWRGVWVEGDFYNGHLIPFLGPSGVAPLRNSLGTALEAWLK